MNSINQNTIVALSTPPGVGALGIIRLSGENAIEITDKIFKGKKLSKQKTHTIHFGKIVEGEKIIDEVVVSIFKNPKSFTGENVVEISCHGSPFILQKVMELCLANGASLAKPGEFTMRAFLNGKMDLSQAEAVADLIASDSENAHKMAINQMRGGFSKRIEALRKRLIKFASLIELELDFGEEDVEFADRTHLKNLIAEIQETIKELTSSFKLGNVLKNGVSTVIAGKPNAGKSTLLNSLLQEERAIVSEIAGTTRDTIEEILNIKGVNFRLIDTAGIREAKDKIESIGVEKTLEKVKKATITVYVFDAFEINLEAVENDLKQLKIDKNKILILANKTDLLEAKKANELAKTGTEKYGSKFQLIQAKNNFNIGAVREQLYKIVVEKNVKQEATMVTNARHFNALKLANQNLQKSLDALNNNISGDLIALDIRASLDALGLITGQIVTDDLLDSIFRDFCIGK